MLPAFITTVLFSLSALFALRSTRAMGGITANFWRLILAMVFLGLWSHLFGVGMRGPALPWLLVSGVLGFGLGDVALFQALPRLGSRLTMLLVHCLATPTAAIVEFIWLGTALSGWQIVCIAVSLFGVAFALAPNRTAAEPRPLEFGRGLAFGLTAMFGQSMGAVLSRKASGVALAAGNILNGIDAAYQRIWGGFVVSLIVYLIYLAKHRIPSRDVASIQNSDTSIVANRRIWVWVLCNSLAGPVLGVSCFQWALATTPTGIVLPIVALTPLVIIPFAHWMEGERTTPREVVGGVIAVAGVVALTRIKHASGG